MSTKSRTSEDIAETRRRNAIRSWALAEMYLRPLFPPEEEARALYEKVQQAAIDIASLQASGLSYDVARRTYIGLPSYLPESLQ
jgi:hypothetical protein